MLRSLYTGISGLRSHQTMMDVTGNNIANVNTTGYKTANTVFEDTLSQTLAAAGAPQGQQGGTNPAQVGLGVRVAGITTNFTQGATQTTGRNTDMLISGDGFFVVRNNGVNQYTRNGSFSPDARGQLVASGGGQVMGWQASATGQVNTTDNVGPVTIPVGLLSNPRATSQLILSGNLNNAATGDAAGTAAVNEAALAGSEFTINWPVYDRQGKSSDISLKVTPLAQTTAGSSAITEWQVSGSYGNPAQVFGGKLTIPVNGGARTFTPSTPTVVAPATALVTTASGAPGSFSIAGLKGSDGAAFDLVVDTAKLTAASQSGAQTSSAKVDSQDGYPAASLSSWNMGPDGTITGTFSSGVTQTLAKIAVANFDNPAGLEKQGGSVYAATVNSGNAAIGSAGEAGRGTLVTGALEMSNVDLAQEFTNLIVSQRGFQANSRVITTSDEMLQELVNLKR